MDMLNNTFKEMSIISNDLAKFEQIEDNLTNESGLVEYLVSQGYKDVTKESAIEVAKDVWEKIKKAIKFLVDKFLVAYNKIKLILADIFNNNEGKIKALIEILKKTDKVAKNELLNNEGFSKKIPMFKNFHEKDLYVNLLKTLTESYSNLFILDNKSYNNIQMLMNYGLEDSKALLKLEPESITTLVLEQHGDYKLKIKTETIKSEYKDDYKLVMKKDSLISILESCLKFNSENLKQLNLLKGTIEKLNNITPSEDPKNIFSINNVEQNVSTSIRAIHMYLENSNKIFKDILYILTQHVRAYTDSTEKINKLIHDEDKYDGNKKIIQDAIKDKDWNLLEEFKSDRLIKKFPDLAKLIEDALKNKSN